MKLIVGNWKMYPKTLAEAKVIAVAVRKVALKTKRTKVVLCPPYPFVMPLAPGKSGRYSIGAQNAFTEEEGARTGEVSPVMLRSVGATHVIIGHSERRALGETDELVASKAALAATSGLTVILCVGERARDESGKYFAEVKEQLGASLRGFPKQKIAQLVIAYEPIWAIGVHARKAAIPKDFEEMAILIRRTLVTQFGKQAAFRVPILYGGSVDEGNAQGFMSEGHADGLLVGRASLDPKRFNAIIGAADLLR